MTFTDGRAIDMPVDRYWFIDGSKTSPPSMRILLRSSRRLDSSTTLLDRYSNVWPPTRTVSPRSSVNSPCLVYDWLATSATEMISTPRCTTMPPLARPTRPRHPWRRVASVSWRATEPAANPASQKPSSEVTPRAPTATANPSATTDAHNGHHSRLDSSSVLADRHGSTGATAMRKSMTSPIGMAMRSKNGAPTDIRSLFTASTIRGNTVPRRITNANAPSSRLLARNAPSRDSGESIAPGDRSRSPRHPISPIEATTMKAKNPSSVGPIEPLENACTDSTTPDRARNVPRIVRLNVATTRVRFHTRSMPRRSCTMTEWMYAVPVSHGRIDAFSTGSHAQ